MQNQHEVKNLSEDCYQSAMQAENNTYGSLQKIASEAIRASNNLSDQDPNFEARILMEHASGLKRAQLMTRSDDKPEAIEKKQFIKAIEERVSGKPIAFILGQQHFWNLELLVDPCTLIPRQDTEHLVEATLALDLREKNAKILDLGTGTGAIALALASERSHWQVLGIDKVAKAVELAKQNAKLNNLQVRFMQSDWFSSVMNKRFDVIVSNPPYIEEGSEYLQRGDLRYEAHSALSSGIDGLADIRHIVQSAPDHLIENGWLLLEHGFNQGQAVRDIMNEFGFYRPQTIKDYQALDRVTIAQLKNCE